MVKALKRPQRPSSRLGKQALNSLHDGLVVLAGSGLTLRFGVWGLGVYGLGFGARGSGFRV